MEWNLKTPLNSSESRQETEPSILSLIGSSSGSQQEGSRIDFSADLKLGGLGDFGSSNQWRDQILRASVAMVTSSGATRRARVPCSVGHIASCSVDGCTADLSKCREYHKRHKVCEIHSKTPIVVVGGREQRFCQQCSRFQSLSEFDEGKRSCRKRLDGHNRRRRKPQLDSLNQPGSLLSNSHAGSIFSSQLQIMQETRWVSFSRKSEQETLHSQCLLPLQFPPLLQQNIGSDRAFSLLSSSSSSSAQSPMMMMYAAPADHDKIRMDQPSSDEQCNTDSVGLYPCFQSSFEDGNVDSNLHCQDVFQQGSSKLSFEGTAGTTSIHWQS